MDLVRLFHWINTHGGYTVHHHCTGKCLYFLHFPQVFCHLLVLFAVILVVFCPHLDSFNVLVSEGLPIQLIFSSVDAQGVG